MTKKKMGGTVASFRKKIREVIAFYIYDPVTVAPIDPERVVSEAKLVDDLGADDLALVEILIAFEEQFELSIPDGDLFAQGEAGDETVQDVYNYFDARVEFE